MWHCRNCGWCVSSMGQTAQEHPQEAAQEAQGQHRPTELQISSTENITISCRIENIPGGQLTPSPLHVSLSRWKVENRGWTFLPSVPPCYLLAFLSWCVDVALAVMFLMCCTRSWVDGTQTGEVLCVPVPAAGCKCSQGWGCCTAPSSWVLSHQLQSTIEICWTSHNSSSFFVYHWCLKNATFLWHRWEMLDTTAKKSQWEPAVVQISFRSTAQMLCRW